LLELARVSPAHQLETICRKYATVQRHGSDARPEDDVQRRYVSRRDTADGMVRIEAVLHPEEAAIVWAALDQIANAQCREPHRVPAETSTADAAALHRQSDNDGDPRYISAETSTTDVAEATLSDDVTSLDQQPDSDGASWRVFAETSAADVAVLDRHSDKDPDSRY